MRTVEVAETLTAPVTFRQLCEHALPERTRFLVLDLDRTVHLGINLGERLGWELSAYQSYGADVLDEIEPTRGRGLLVLKPRWPRSMAHFTAAGLYRWSRPGLRYLVFGKLASTRPWLKRIAQRRYGEHFMREAQRGAQLTLMEQLGNADPALVRELAKRVWERHAREQVIMREDLSWLRSRHPGIEIILTSASPEPTVVTAATMLGADLCIYSTPDRINSGIEKIERLREARPAVLDPSHISVGISDTQYGEDHSWSEHLSVVIDINSDWPFPRMVSRDSPLRAAYSASVLTQHEQTLRAAGQPDYLDPLRFKRRARPAP